MITNPAFPITASPDYYIRLSAKEISGLVWEHAYSQPVTRDHVEGMTEWTAEVRGVLVSLSWSWTRLAGGSISFTEPAIVLSNLMLMDPKGYDVAPEEMSHALVQIASKLEWQREVIRAIEPKKGHHYH